MQYARRVALAVAIIGAICLPAQASAQTYDDGSRPLALGAGSEQAVREFYGQVAAYVAWRVAEDQRIADYVTAAEQAREAQAEHDAEVAREAAVAAAQRQSVPSSSTPVSAGGGGGSCYGGVVPDWVVNRESHGNPGVYNTGGSGAWGCFQIMPGTWNSPSVHCGDIAPFGQASADQQKECAQRIYDVSGSSPWGGF